MPARRPRPAPLARRLLLALGLSAGAALAAGLGLSGCDKPAPADVLGGYTGIDMARGHALRDRLAEGAPYTPDIVRRTQVVIAGGGVAGLAAARALRLAGVDDFQCLEMEDQPGGNSRAGSVNGIACPLGAHYLPVPGEHAREVQDLLEELGLRQRVAGRWRYDERHLCHSPQERLYFEREWQEGLLPVQGVGEATLEQYRRFSQAVGAASRAARFTMPQFAALDAKTGLAPAHQALDAMTFEAWLQQQGLDDAHLRWYLDYCCRDDYGSTLAQTSAWAGLHYFAARGGHAANAEDGAVLTWPDGLAPLLRHMRGRIGAERQLDGAAWRIQMQGQQAQVDYVDAGGAQRLLARRVIVATPLHVAWHLLPQLADLGFARAHLPPRAPWLVGNVLLDRFPQEPEPSPLAWDNVVYGSAGLGYVVATHQLIRAALPERTVFTTYHAFADAAPAVTRPWLAAAGADALFELAAADLYTVYGAHLRRQLLAARLTVRAHAMASPQPDFLANAGLAALRAADGPILFAHSDLSGLSLFEEAAWWGDVAARRVLG